MTQQEPCHPPNLKLFIIVVFDLQLNFFDNLLLCVLLYRQLQNIHPQVVSVLAPTLFDEIYDCLIYLLFILGIQDLLFQDFVQRHRCLNMVNLFVPIFNFTLNKRLDDCECTYEHFGQYFLLKPVLELPGQRRQVDERRSDLGFVHFGQQELASLDFVQRLTHAQKLYLLGVLQKRVRDSEDSKPDLRLPST